MNINNRINRLSIVDKQYKLRQLIDKDNESVVQFSQKYKYLKKSTEETDKAA
ncbi:hypothetical protein [Hyella patelloides]|nr:hypothetical protein [Hyella patelloides]